MATRKSTSRTRSRTASTKSRTTRSRRSTSRRGTATSRRRKATTADIPPHYSREICNPPCEHHDAHPPSHFGFNPRPPQHRQEVRTQGAGESRRGDARTQAWQTSLRQRTEGDEPQAGDCDRSLRSTSRGRKGATQTRCVIFYLKIKGRPEGRPFPAIQTSGR